jgi:hypothetical protein
MKSDHFSDEFDYFYMELPQADYLNDLTDIPIQDEHYADDEDPGIRGLSDEQVSKLADDSRDTSKTKEYRRKSPAEQELFESDE